MKFGVEVNYVVLKPTDPQDAPTGAMFLDATNGNVPTLKSTAGIVSQLGSTNSEPAANLFLKQMQAGGAFQAKVPLSKRPDGRVVEAKSDGAQNHIGFSLSQASTDGDLIVVLCVGPNITDALEGLGFTPGQEVFVGETGAYSTTPGSFTGTDDSIIKVGIADCKAGTASAEASDLIVFSEVIMRPMMLEE